MWDFWIIFLLYYPLCGFKIKRGYLNTASLLNTNTLSLKKSLAKIWQIFVLSKFQVCFYARILNTFSHFCLSSFSSFNSRFQHRIHIPFLFSLSQNFIAIVCSILLASFSYLKIEFYNAENWPVFLVHLVNFVVGFFVLHPMLTFDLAEENKVMHFTITFGLHVTSPFYISTLLCSARKKYELCISWEKTTSRMKNQYVLIRAA